MKDETTLKIEYLEREISELKRLTNRSERPVSMVSRKSWKKRLPVLLAAVSILSAVGLATAADIPHTFGTGGVISATKFNENFTYIVDRLWDKDGTNLYYNDGGDVGIGTASPDRELHVKQSASTSGNGIRIENSTGSKNLKFYVDTTGAVIDAFSGADLLLRTESSDRLTILNAGNVGIGTTGPGSKLEIKGSGSTNATAGLNVTNSAGTSGLYVRDDGNVGIGTTEPNAKFAVQQTGGEDAIIVQDSAQPTTTQLQLATDSIDM
ncbi:MAG: hypothetical protein GY866_15490, partial [Proteobacteria bacterium]|nr:hypothetical protein [Pseudomonadota bacterium]